MTRKLLLTLIAPALLAGVGVKERRLLADLLRQVLSRVEPAAGG